MIRVGGGRTGVRDFTLIHSAVERPKASFAGKILYHSIWLQAAALIQSLIKNHPFEDGNKRTGFFSTLRFLNINGFDISTSKKEIVNFALEIDVKKLSINKISYWLNKHSKKIRL
ncbi:hypothetical protein A2774_01015 [Candidatus Roizmanbacteria bacterium RIFCSPHIGHO2_01_FULL_39_12c]|uniref:Fido domain-containing protein n=1 Tax=Candidatus Roizmanbacteria bacterium RIFCSPHIGHO2_01_FULL_39_12c TaxID=1802031 RepID=A0A1F7G7Z8_9BACT|nr:MAG: hypothetical protein A2774_01015 [Candidatus Roizmanbacteria bacterium RIFCSPHIGHO2_01_FULL_39_12c]OGK46412.1 MAG: hypothetical protein A2963_01425 [Candidatus Roizmanbacteria bacterium RIFCSPLOWO2_01_FULL_40_13]